MNKIYLLLGSNMGNSRKRLAEAILHIEKKIGDVIRQSSVYQTAAWGKRDQADFLNQVIVIKSNFTAEQIMQTILTIETKMGRVRNKKNDPRIIDIDILYYNKIILERNNLIIPHPAIQARRFVLVPLNELAPLFIHPLFMKTNHRLLQECEDTLDVKKIK
ncbi:MAG: 2-amino-4-hydroxy-6-hydroxymethyldihydropteridine diphosphokinase [Ferruginibacter sp.]